MNVELGVNALHISAYGCDGQHQIVADFFRPLVLRQELKGLHFALGELELFGKLQASLVQFTVEAALWILLGQNAPHRLGVFFAVRVKSDEEQQGKRDNSHAADKLV